MKVEHLIDVSWSHNVLRAHSVHHVLSKLLLDVRVGGQAVQTPSKCMGCLKGGKTAILFQSQLQKHYTVKTHRYYSSTQQVYKIYRKFPRAQLF